MSEDAPRLYLITPPLSDAAAFSATFSAALEAGDVACVLLRFDGRADAEAIAGSLVPVAQARGVACLVGDAHLAARADADGVHMDTPGPTLEAAVAAMKPKRIVGVGGIVSRDDAMRAGESGVDYLMFGGPGAALSFPEIRERIAWWAEIFNLACVGYARRLDEVAAAAMAGSDFIALDTAVWDDPRGAAVAVAHACSMLSAGHVGA